MTDDEYKEEAEGGDRDSGPETEEDHANKEEWRTERVWAGDEMAFWEDIIRQGREGDYGKRSIIYLYFDISICMVLMQRQLLNYILIFWFIISGFKKRTTKKEKGQKKEGHFSETKILCNLLCGFSIHSEKIL